MGDGPGCGFMLTLMLLAGFGGFCIGMGWRGDSFRTEAIEAGVAEWRIDPKTGEAEFAWLRKEAGK